MATNRRGQRQRSRACRPQRASSDGSSEQNAYPRRHGSRWARKIDVMAVDDIKQLIAHGAGIKIKLTAPQLAKEFIALAVKHDGHVELVGGAPPSLLLE